MALKARIAVKGRRREKKGQGRKEGSDGELESFDSTVLAVAGLYTVEKKQG